MRKMTDEGKSMLIFWKSLKKAGNVKKSNSNKQNNKNTKKDKKK